MWRWKPCPQGLMSLAALSHQPPGKALGSYWDRIKCKKLFGNPVGAVERQASINPDSQIWKSLEDSLPKLYCADLAEAYVTWGKNKLEAYANKMVRAAAKTKAVAKISPKYKATFEGSSVESSTLVSSHVTGSIQPYSQEKYDPQPSNRHLHQKSMAKSENGKTTGYWVYYECPTKVLLQEK
jgi:hypothetical protein